MNIKNSLLGLLSAFTILAACKKTDLGTAPRLFRPVVSGTMVADSNAIQVSWANISAASTYTLQVSRDTFRTIDVTLQVDTNSVLVKNLKWDQLYQLQVRANASDTSQNSKWSYLGAIKTPKFPSILKSPTISDFTDEAIKVSWTNSGATVTSIKLLKPSDSSVVRDIALTSADVTAQYKIISGLPSNTSFIVMLYSGTRLRGYDTYTTKAPETGTIIDLRNITDRPSVLQDTIPTLQPGSKVLLKRGFTYTIASTTLLSNSITIKSGTDLTVAEPANIYFTSNFNFGANSTIDYIDFEDVAMKSDNYASRYIFNTTNSATVGRISFNNCKMEIFRGVCRLQSGTTTLTDFKINNCIVDSIAGYGAITVDNTTCKAENISITNSTLYKMEKIIASKSNSTSITLQALTINEAPFGTGNYVIDYNGPTVTTPVVIKDIIIGIGKNSNGSIAVRGVRISNGVLLVSNSYSTADYTLQATTPFAITDLIPYTKTSTQIWQDPFNGNFKLIDATLASKGVGDPRWR